MPSVVHWPSPRWSRGSGGAALLVGDLVAVCGFLLLYALAPDLWIGAVALLLVGASYIGVLAGCNTVVQLNAPPALRGRMLGLYMMALGILYPIGALIQGWLGGWVGLRVVTGGGAVLLLLLIAGGLATGRFPRHLDGAAAVGSSGEVEPPPAAGGTVAPIAEMPAS